MKVPDRLINAASPQLRAFQARSPLFSAADRLKSAEIATGLGVFSSQSMIDLYSAIYDATDPSDLSQTDAWQVRQAFVGKDRDARVAAIRRLLDAAKDPLPHEARRALVGRAASLIAPDRDLQSGCAGTDRGDARRRLRSRRRAMDRHGPDRMDGDAADRSWAMLALRRPDPRGLDLGGGRIIGFISRDKSPGEGAQQLARRRARRARADRCGAWPTRSIAASALGIGRQSSWTQDDRRRRRSRPVGHACSS